MNIVIIAQAYNRKNGANGSLIDLFCILKKLEKKPIFVAYKRNKYLAKIEAILNKESVLESILNIKSLNFVFKKKLNNSIFFCTNIELPLLEKLKLTYPNSKFLTFQTGNLPNNENLNFLYKERLTIFDYILFQSPKHYSNYKLHYSSSGYAKPILTYATTSIENSRFGSIQKYSKDTIILYCAGSIQPRKNQILLIKEFQKVVNRKELNNCKLVFSGPLINDSYSEYCKNFIAMVEADSNIDYLGNKKDYYKIMERADIIISASMEEGLSTIIREAMFMKKCIIASNIDGNIGVLDHNVNSLLFNPTDCGHGLIELIYSAVKSLDLRNKLGENAYNFYCNNLSNIEYEIKIKSLVSKIV